MGGQRKHRAADVEVEFTEYLEKIVVRLHDPDVPVAVKAQIAIHLARVHELDGRLVDAAVLYETAFFFRPTKTLARTLSRSQRRIARRLDSVKRADVVRDQPR